MSEARSNLTARAIKVLEAVIHAYVTTGKAVGSRCVVKDFNLDCSPATVRNEMSELADMGYLAQTHLSSGRVPTDAGIRFYLNYIMCEEQLSMLEIEQLSAYPSMYGEDYRSTVRNAGRVLADMSRQAAVVMMPGLKSVPLTHIEFALLKQKRIVATIVLEGGRFFNRVFDWGEDLQQRELTWASNYLNERFKGKTLHQINNMVLKEIREEKAEYDKTLGRALGFMETVLEREHLDEEVIIEGRENLVEKPEFKDAEKIISLLKTLEEKKFIAGLLEKAVDEGRPLIILPSEVGIGNATDLAVIVARYGITGPGGGTLGIIGSRRMNYSKVIPMVRYAARRVSNLLNS